MANSNRVIKSVNTNTYANGTVWVTVSRNSDNKHGNTCRNYVRYSWQTDRNPERLLARGRAMQDALQLEAWVQKQLKDDPSIWQIGNQQHEDNTLYCQEVGEGLKRWER